MEEAMAKEREGTGRNSRWQEWYPTVVPDLNIPLEHSPYGEPNKETVSLFSQLKPGSKIGDIGGGEGRYALPLARMGHTVLVTDVDSRHLNRAKRKNTLPGVDGVIFPVQSDATGAFPITDKSLDAVLNAGFGYLIPPETLDPLVEKMAQALQKDGLLVFEFATNRERRDMEGNSLIGPYEYRYGYEEGVTVLESLAQKHGIGDMSLQTKEIRLEEPYQLHTDLIIAHGYKE